MERNIKKKFEPQIIGEHYTKKALCVYGGGLRAMSGASALISAALATEHNLSQDLQSDDKGQHLYDDAMYNLMSDISLVSSNSGGSWFTYALLMSPKFNDVLRYMTLKFVFENSTGKDSDAVGKENPFLAFFLSKSLKNISDWNEQVYYHQEMRTFEEVWERFQDSVRKHTPKIGGDLALFLKHSFCEGNIWNSFVEILMSPLTSDSNLPPWYQKVGLDWFINVTLNLPRIGPLTSSNPPRITNSDSKNKAMEGNEYRNHGSVIRFISSDKTFLEYIVNNPEIETFEPNYVGNYKRLRDNVFGRVDLVPAAFKISSERSEGLSYNFTSPSLKNLSVEYYVSDAHGVPLSSKHIEQTVVCPSFDFINQTPIHLVQSTLSSSTYDSHGGLEEERRARMNKKFRSWIKTRLGGEKPDDNAEEFNEILYRVAASSAAVGGSSNLTVDLLTDLSPEEIESKGIRANLKKRDDLSDLLFHNPVGWMRGSMVDVIEDFDISVLFGNIDTLKMRYDLLHGTKSSRNISECSLRGERLGEECDRLLGEGKLLSYDGCTVEKSLNSTLNANSNSGLSVTDSAQPQQKITLREYADMFPLNVSDGGYTDNTGIGRAVMEGATHITCFAFNTEDFIGLFQNNEIEGFPYYLHFEIFECSKDEMENLKKILSTEQLEDFEDGNFLEGITIL